MENFLITIATEGDITAIVQLVNAAYRGDTSRKGWTTEADLLDGIRLDEATLREMIDQKDAVVLKFENAKKVIDGCVYLHKQMDKLYLGMLTVNPKKQAKGIGKLLLAEAEEYAKKVGCSKIEITVITTRYELIDWYQRHGYSKTDETKPFPSDTRFGIPKQPLEFCVMQKILEN